MAKNDGGQAFPGDDFGYGMSLRDWFAGQALGGMCADPEQSGTWEQRAEWAYKCADALLVERDREG